MKQGSMTRRQWLAAGTGVAATAAGRFGAATASAQDHSELPSLLSRVRPIAAEEFAQRQEKARRLMAAAGIDAILLMGGSSLYYFMGMNWGRSERLFAAVLPRRGDIVWICPAFERQRAEEVIRFSKDLRVWEEDESPYRMVRQICAERRARVLGIEETVPFSVAAGLARDARAISRVPANPVTAGCRMVKSPAEIELMELAAEATRNAIAATFAALREGMEARQIAEAVAAAHARQGTRHLFAVVGIGEGSAFPHGSTRQRKLRDGDVVLIDAGCAVQSYQSDLTRTTVFGKPTDRQRSVWEAVKSAQTRAFEAARPGASAESLDAAARKVIEDAGLGPGYKYFTHRLGHGIGLDGHEWPYLVRGNKLALRPGMTFSNEPGVYLYGEFGVRLEDVMVITETGARLLTLQAQTIGPE